jgi:hypothetical protein
MQISPNVLAHQRLYVLRALHVDAMQLHRLCLVIELLKRAARSGIMVMEYPRKSGF